MSVPLYMDGRTGVCCKQLSLQKNDCNNWLNYKMCSSFFGGFLGLWSYQRNILKTEYRSSDMFMVLSYHPTTGKIQHILMALISRVDWVVNHLQYNVSSSNEDENDRSIMIRSSSLSIAITTEE
jgi:hypothetical protein